MRNPICTNTEQSKRLLSCGVDPETADLVWLDDGNNRSRLTILTPIISDRYKIAPAWSLSRLISLLPKLIRNEDMDKCRLSIDSIYNECCTDNIEDGWEVAWFSYGEINTFTRPENIRFRNESLIEVCVKAIEWLTEHNYPLNKIEE